MSLFADFIGGAAEAAKTNIDNEMAEKAAQKREAWRMKMQEMYGIRAEKRDELRQNKAAELAYDRAQIDAEARQRAEEIRQQGLLERERIKAEQRSRDAQFNRDTQFGVADRYAASRMASGNKRKQEMDFGFNSNPTLDFIKTLTL